jgi:hypothetical protein
MLVNGDPNQVNQLTDLVVNDATAFVATRDGDLGAWGLGSDDYPVAEIIHTGLPDTRRIVRGDFNAKGESKRATLIASSSTTNVAVVYYEPSKSPYGRVARSDIGVRTRDAAAGDIDGDGYDDLGVLDDEDKVDVCHGLGDATFAPVSERHGVGLWYGGEGGATSPSQIIAADLNGDGRTDFVVNSTYEVHIFIARTDGTIAPNVYMNGYNYIGTTPVLRPLRTLAADVDGDAKTDLIIGGPHDIGIFFGTGDGVSFTRPASYPIDPSGSSDAQGGLLDLAMGDFNGDGIRDLIALDLDDAGHSHLHTFVGLGGGSFGAAHFADPNASDYAPGTIQTNAWWRLGAGHLFVGAKDGLVTLEWPWTAIPNATFFKPN